MKKILFSLFFFLIFCLNISPVNADIDFNSVATAIESSVSDYCNTSICGSTDLFNINLDNPNSPKIPFFGVRISLVNSSGYRVTNSKGYYVAGNFWASSDMRSFAYGGTYSNKFRNSFSDGNAYILRTAGYQFYSDKGFISPELFDSKKDKVNYTEVVDKLKNYDILKNLYDKYLNCNAPNTSSCDNGGNHKINKSFDDLINSDYYFKIEPIYIFLATNYGKKYWYMGTSYEIGKSIAADVNSGVLSDAFTNGAFKGGNNGYWGGDFYVFDNFLTSLYLDKNVAGYSGVDVKKESVRDRFWNLLNNPKKGWSKGVIYLRDISKNKLRIVKKSGNSSKSKAYGDTAYFRLYRVSSDNKWNLFTTKDVADGTFKTKKVGNDQILDINGFSNGDYYLCEINIPDNISNVQFKMKNDNDKKINNTYSLDLGNKIPSKLSSVASDLRACSNKFSITGADSQEYIIVYNEKKDNNDKITIIKKLGIYSDDGSTYKSYPHDSSYELRLNGIKVANASLNANSTEVSFAYNKFSGTQNYQLCETSIDNSYIKTVHFREKKEGDGSDVFSISLGDIVPLNNKACTTFKYDAGSGEKRILILNEPKDTSKLRIYKKKGTKDSGSTWYRDASVTFKVCEATDLNSCVDAVKRTGDFYVDVDGSKLLAGTEYVIKEIVSENTNGVHFYMDDKVSLGSVNLNNTTGDAISNTFTYLGSGSTQKIYVYNDMKSECDVELDKIISKCPNGKCDSSMSARIISDLKNLYGEFGNNNLLMNYGYDKNGLLDISQTSCASATCKSNSEFECKTGTLSYNVNKDTIKYETDSSRRVNNFYNLACYASDSSGIVNYTYVDDENNFDAKCGVTYKYSFYRFNDDSFNSGNLLWEMGKNKPLGLVTINFECYFSDSLSDGEDKNAFLDKLKLNINKLKDDLSPSLSMSLMDDENSSDWFNSDFVHPYSDISPKDKGCEGNNCFAYWNSNFDLNTFYSTKWYFVGDSNNGKFVKEEFLNHDVESSFSGYGFPLSLNTISKNGLEAKLSFSAVATDTKEYYSICKYNVINDFLLSCEPGDDNCSNNDNNFNFEFRIIDTRNPFPGKSGNNRLTGSNWCASSLIGKKVYFKNDDDVDYKIIGDFNNDFNINAADINKSEDDFKSNIDIADINSSGEIEYVNVNENASLCDDVDLYSSDNCILYNYINGNDDKVCSTDNVMVKKYITDRLDSSSNELPMYTFTLTPTDINNIREYNRNHAYNDFNLKCEDGLKTKCVSEFLSNWIIKHTINGNNVSNNLSNDNSSCFNTRFDGNWCDIEEVTS